MSGKREEILQGMLELRSAGDLVQLRTPFGWLQVTPGGIKFADDVLPPSETKVYLRPHVDPSEIVYHDEA